LDNRTDSVNRSGARDIAGGRSVGQTGKGRNAWIAALGVLAALELAWLAWFLIVPLPNANSVGVPPEKAVRRGLLLLKAFPEVVPDTPFRDSFLGRALAELSHVENLPQRIPIVLTAALVALAALGLGDLALRTLSLARDLTLGERIALDYGLGAGLLGVATLVLGRMGWLHPWVFRGALAAIALGGIATSQFWRAPRIQFGTRSLLFLLTVGPFVLVMFLGAMLPSIDFDVLEYHLQAPKEYYQNGCIAFLPHNVYTNMPFGVEMLHLMAMEVLDDWWWGGLAGQLLVSFFAPAAALLIAATTARIASTRAAWIAACVYLSTPWVYRVAVLAYVEGPLCYYHAALLWVVTRFMIPERSPPIRDWGLIGLLAGCAMGCKYPALFSAVIPFGLVAIVAVVRRRTFAPLAWYFLGWAIVMGPWLGKNVIDSGNPVYPLAQSVFHGRHWDTAREEKWSAAHGRRPVTAPELWNSLVDVAGRSDWQSPLYLAFAPLALLHPGSRRAAFLLWGFVVYLFFTWWLLTHRLDRFWLPLLPPLAILAGQGADWCRGRAWTAVVCVIVAIGLISNFTLVSTALAGLNEWTGDLEFLRRDVPRRWNAALYRLDSELPENARPLLVGQAAVFHLRRRVDYNTVFNPETIEVLARNQSPDAFRRALHERKLTHIYVDWKEIERHRQPGGYGFTDFVTSARFAEWVAAGVLERPVHLGSQQELYEIR
jgi:hypothetical protein